MNAQVIIKFEIEGFHKYENAPATVKFLRDSHRHTFKIVCAYDVTDYNREKEIFLERAFIKQYLNESYGSPCYFGNMSCEMIAKDILQFGKIDNMCWVEVHEEETGGARVEI